MCTGAQIPSSCCSSFVFSFPHSVLVCHRGQSACVSSCPALFIALLSRRRIKSLSSVFYLRIKVVLNPSGAATVEDKANVPIVPKHAPFVSGSSRQVSSVTRGELGCVVEEFPWGSCLPTSVANRRRTETRRWRTCHTCRRSSGWEKRLFVQHESSFIINLNAMSYRFSVYDLGERDLLAEYRNYPSDVLTCVCVII